MSRNIATRDILLTNEQLIAACEGPQDTPAAAVLREKLHHVDTELETVYREIAEMNGQAMELMEVMKALENSILGVSGEMEVLNQGMVAFEAREQEFLLERGKTLGALKNASMVCLLSP